MPPDAVPLLDAGPGSGLPLAGARRVMVVRLDNLGDVLLTGPVFRALRSALPAAELVLLASPGGSAAGAVLPWVDRVEPLRAVWQDAQGRLAFDPLRELGVIERLRRIDADAAVILTSFSQTSWAPAYACYLAGIQIRAGHAPDFGGGLLSHPVTAPAATHQAERNLQVPAALGVGTTDMSLEAAVPPAAREAVAACSRITDSTTGKRRSSSSPAPRVRRGGTRPTGSRPPRAPSRRAPGCRSWSRARTASGP
jgi:hypothetical protein